MNQVNSQGLLKSILGFFARKPPETSTQPVSLRTQALDAWVRTDAYLQHETSDFGEVDPEQLARTLAKFENLVHYGSDRGQDHVSKIIPRSKKHNSNLFLLTSERTWKRT